MSNQSTRTSQSVRDEPAYRTGEDILMMATVHGAGAGVAASMKPVRGQHGWIRA